MKISGNIVDIHKREIYPGEIYFDGAIIREIRRVADSPAKFIIPGLIDAHIHIESSMVTPGAFATTAVRHGTTAVVSDPHEIANVLGVDGVTFMIDDAAKVPLKFFFGAPSCVPATSFETSGGTLDSDSVKNLLGRKEIKYLSEMMNFPGVVYSDAEVKSKLESARLLSKPIDGHAPGLSGEQLKIYAEAGISTDHECSSIAEAREKIALGMKILIREGSAARNLDSLKELFRERPEMLMLCSDDLHPEMLAERHINKIIAKLISEGYDKFDVLRSASLNPVLHYGLDCGLLREKDRADFVIVDNLETMNVSESWIDGQKVFSERKVCFEYSGSKALNNFRCSTVTDEQIAVRNTGTKYRVIEAIEGELITKEIILNSGSTEYIKSDTANDILKIVVKDRYTDGPPAIGFIKGFGLKNGALASSVAHDSHNIIAVGSDDREIAAVINELVRLKGGLAVYGNGSISSIQLDIAGIMTTRSCEDIAAEYQELNKLASAMGCPMRAPFMTLAFMALLVIPDLKIGDKGLFDVKNFCPVSLFV
jgi:adenine deaminase